MLSFQWIFDEKKMYVFNLNDKCKYVYVDMNVFGEYLLIHKIISCLLLLSLLFSSFATSSFFIKLTSLSILLIKRCTSAILQSTRHFCITSHHHHDSLTSIVSIIWHCVTIDHIIYHHTWRNMLMYFRSFITDADVCVNLVTCPSENLSSRN